MGKKEKGAKKKGPLKKLSKCLFFWGSKRKSSKELKQESPLKRAHSESSVANTLCSENTAPSTAKQDLDSANAGECSSSHRHSHFQVYCDISDTIEQEDTGKSMPDFKLQQNEKLFAADLKDSTKPNTTNLNTETCKPIENDKCNDEVDNGKFRRFTITAVSNASDSSIDNVHTKELEVTALPNSEKELKKSLLCQSSLNSDDKKHIEPQIFQPNEGSNCNSNKKIFSQAKNFRESFDSSNDNPSQAEKENCQLNLVCRNYTNNNEVNHSESSICQYSFSSQFSTSNIGEKHSEPLIFQSSLNYANCTSNVNTNHPEHLACQDDFESISCTRNVAEHSVPQISHQNSSDSYKSEIVPLHSEPQIGQHNFNLSNFPDETQNQLQIDTSKIRAIDQTRKVDGHHLESQKFEDVIIHEGQSSSDLVNCTIDSLETESLPADSKEKHIIDSLEERNVAIMRAIDNEESSQFDSNSDNDTSHSIFDDDDKNSYEVTTTNKSNFDFSTNNENIDTNYKLIPSLEAEEVNICLNSKMNSSSHASSQPFDTIKNSENFLQAIDHNGNPSHTSKCDDEYLKRNNQTQLVESYPSISVIKGTSEIGMTLVVLPYINSAGDNGNWKISDLADKGNCQSEDVGKSLNIDEEKVSIPSNEADMQAVSTHNDEKSVQERKNNTLTKSTKPSRVPVRKLAEPGHIVDKISRLSMEIEELNSNIKQKSLDDSLKSNSSNKSVSRIPRKCS